MKHKYRNTIISLILIASCLLVVSIILFPFVWMVLTSLKTNPEAMAIPITWFPRQLTFENYFGIWKGYHFTVYFFNSLIVSSMTALIATFVGALAGYGFSRYRFAGRSILISCFLITQMISGTVIIGPYFKILSKTRKC